MIDGIKTYLLIDKVKPFLDLSFVKWEQKTNLKTGEMLYPVSSYNYGLYFKILEGNKTKNLFFNILGSLHKYKNHGIHNYDDFLYKDLCSTIDGLCIYNITPNKLSLKRFEFGVNLELNITAQKFLKYLVAFNNKPFQALSVTGKSLEIGSIAVTSQYNLKIYDKGKQSDLKNKKLLRVELSITKMQVVSHLGIRTVNDLKDKEKLKGLALMLLEKLKNIVVYDETISENKLTDRELKLLLRYKNPKFWGMEDRKARYKHKQRFNKIIEKYGANKYLNKFIKQVKSKFLTLLDCQQLEEKKATFLPRNSQIKKDEKGDVFTHIINTEKCPLGSIKNESLKTVNFKSKKTNKVRTCFVCDKIIENPKPNKKYCSKKCNNVNSNKKRVQRNREKIISELENLNSIKIIKINFSVVIFSKDCKPVKKKIKSLKLLEYKELRKIIKLEVCRVGRKKNYVFTTIRAKQVYKYLTDK